jgi:hypothetical protein
MEIDGDAGSHPRIEGSRGEAENSNQEEWPKSDRASVRENRGGRSHLRTIGGHRIVL